MTAGNIPDKAIAAPLRRASFAAWAVFLGMAGTTMAFQTYHSLHVGQMPWPLAYLYGVVPLAISIGVLTFAAVWPSSLARAGAYAVTAGAMYMSASATGAVTLRAASPHADLLFGFLLDGAALLAVRFIFDGPTAGQAVAAVAKREAELIAAAESERTARQQEMTARRAELDQAAAASAAEKQRLEAELASIGADLATARSETETAARQAEVLTRKLNAATGGGKTGSGPRKPAGDPPRKPEPLPAEAAALNPDDLPGNWDELDTEARVLFLVNDKDYSASKAGIAAGVTDARGRQIVRLARGLDGTAPQDIVGGSSVQQGENQ